MCTTPGHANCAGSQKKDGFDYVHLRVPLPKITEEAEIGGIWRGKIPGNYFLMRRVEDDYISATGMFRAAFPWASKEEESAERLYLSSREESDDCWMFGNIWVPPAVALELAESYHISIPIRALLESSVPVTNRTVIAQAHVFRPPKHAVSLESSEEGPDEDLKGELTASDSPGPPQSEDTLNEIQPPEDTSPSKEPHSSPKPSSDAATSEGPDTEDSSENGPTSSQQQTVYDPEGDVLLIVGQTDPNRFLTSSKLLISISSVWKDLIESTAQSDMKTINLPDDNATCISIMLQIAHLQFSALPKTLSFQEIYALACLSRRYLAHELFMPFVPGWLRPYIRKQLDPKYTEWMLIAWEFRVGAILEAWMDHLCVNSAKGSDGSLVFRGHRLDDLLPDTALYEPRFTFCFPRSAASTKLPIRSYSGPNNETMETIIERERNSLLSHLVKVCEKTFESSCCVHTDELPYKERCNSITAGYLVRGLNKWPLNASAILASVEEFTAQLLDLCAQPSALAADVRFGDEDHSECGLTSLMDGIAGCYCHDNELCFRHKRLGKDNSGADVGVSTIQCLYILGFQSRDFDLVDSDSETDSDYAPLSDVGSEPEEEYASDGFCSRDGAEEDEVDGLEPSS
ncbi:hypothetical protein AJ80_04196 [Polytolypa hystricis UAMH7299]|uniref:Cell pattern formation-associated protein stuA n=1 Tax=Polytolypa hystricis (strain UAMH7299) TaxID=1447883 RepID=A0A2B7YDY9_POLH7|nr:hypothetical protein AJ80_04196 [Polytolypa hystricis UAMH7299]